MLSFTCKPAYNTKLFIDVGSEILYDNGWDNAAHSYCSSALIELNAAACWETDLLQQ